MTILYKYYNSMIRLVVNGWNDLYYFGCQLHLWGSIPTNTIQQTTKSSIQKSISILTYNVDFSTVQDPIKTRTILSAMDKANADIVCLQETNPKWEESLLACCKYEHFYFHHPQNRPAGGLAILSKFQIQSCHVMNTNIPGSVFPALFVTLQIIHDDNDNDPVLLRLANIHLRPPLELNGTATLSTPRTTRPIRTQELHHYTSYGSCLDLLVGDFNEQDTYLNQMITIMKPNSWRNALTEFVPKKKETHIWPFAYLFSLKKRLDHIFYNTQTLVCHSCTVIPGYEYGASDHQPVLGQFTFRNS